MSVRWLVSSWQLHDALIWHLMTVWDESCKCHELTRHLNLTNPMRHANVTNSKRHFITWHLMSLWVREFHSSEFVTSIWRIELTSHWWNPLKWIRDIYMTHWVDISLKSNDFASWWNLDDSWVRDRHMTCWDHTSECQKVWCILDKYFFWIWHLRVCRVSQGLADDSWVRDRHMPLWDNTSECQKVRCILENTFIFRWHLRVCRVSQGLFRSVQGVRKVDVF